MTPGQRQEQHALDEARTKEADRRQDPDSGTAGAAQTDRAFATQASGLSAFHNSDVVKELLKLTSAAQKESVRLIEAEGFGSGTGQSSRTAGTGKRAATQDSGFFADRKASEAHVVGGSEAAAWKRNDRRTLQGIAAPASTRPRSGRPRSGRPRAERPSTAARTTRIARVARPGGKLKSALTKYRVVSPFVLFVPQIPSDLWEAN